MRCLRCHSDNPDTQTLCTECGSELERICPVCGCSNPLRFTFCGGCGRNLLQGGGPPLLDYDRPQSYTPKHLADKILTTRSAVEGERKWVTVLFADVAESTAIFERLDPEEVHRIMNECFQIMMDEIHGYEGTVNQFRGDGLMAIFGAPLAHEDHAQRACCAALAIQNRMEQYTEEVKARYGFDFEMRIGLNSGPVVVGSIGDDLRMDYTADGDTTNLAARMEQLAEPGTIYVANETFRHAGKLFDFQYLGDARVKGKKTAVPVHELVSSRRYQPRLRSERIVYTHLIGRAEELKTLERQVMKTIDGVGSVVNVIGEAGIGKSRLVAELKKREVMKRVTLVEGRAISIGKNLSFHPIIDLFKQWAQIKETDSDAAAFARLETAVRRICPDEVHEILPFVATLMGMRLTGDYAERLNHIQGEALEKLILRSLRRLLIKASELSPLVLITEDLHWSDDSSIEVMTSLFRLAESQRILFINVFRPGQEHSIDRAARVVKETLPDCCVDVRLNPMNERMSEELIRNMLDVKVFHHPIISQIIARAGGNPFFMEEVVRSLIDDEAVVVKDGKFLVTDKLDTTVVPSTINDVLMARIDRLDEETRDLVKIASVIGRSFFYKILREVTRSIEELDNKLLHLKDVQLIRERTRMGELEYLFKHALAQETAYRSILLRKRKQLHLRVADSIEKVFKERLHEFYGMLAYHYSKGEDEEKAEEYLVKAGEESLRSSASTEALNYYQEGLRLYLEKYGDNADPERVAAFEKNIAIAFFNKGQYEKALHRIDDVLMRWGHTLPRNRAMIILGLFYDFCSLIVNLYVKRKKPVKGPGVRENEIFDLSYKKALILATLRPERCFIEYLRVARMLNQFDIEKVPNGVGMWISISGLFSWTGISFRLSKRILEYSKDSIDRENVKEVLFYELFDLVHQVFTGNWTRITAYDPRLVEQNLEIGESWHVSTYTIFHGFVKIERGRFQEAHGMITKLSEIWETYENENAKEYVLMLGTILLMKSGEYEQALSTAEESVAFQGRTGREFQRIWGLGLKAISQFYLDDVTGAEESLSQARELIQPHRLVPHTYISSYLTARFLVDLSRLEAAVSAGDRGRRVQAEKKAAKSGKAAVRISHKNALCRTECFRLMGLFNWVTGKQKQAIRWWNESAREGTELGAHVELARTYKEMGSRLQEERSRHGAVNGLQAEQYLEKAATITERIKRQSDLDLLDET